MGPDIDLGRHARHQFQIADGLNICFRERHPRHVVLLSLCACRGRHRIAGEIGRHHHYFAPEIGRRAPVTGFEADAHWCAGCDLVDILRRNLRFDNQGVGPRHDLHQCVALADYAPDRVDLELINGACLRRAYLGVLEFVFGRICTLLQCNSAIFA